MKCFSTFLILLVLLSFARAEDICVKDLSVMMPYSGKLQYKECKYYVREETIIGLPDFAPKSGVDPLPMLKVLATAYDQYFSKHGVPSETFYEEATVSLEKVDDFTMSAIANNIRTRGSKIRNLWFYIVSFGDRNFGGAEPRPAPLLILTDGTLIFPSERLKGAP
jgi:hypothetical protein